ncbi:MAG TPA: Wzz/FepE/Etk N-terminal domain-containing protein [Terriglobales bacterium]|nr:Wzz/FepE/Etk N-terminal domain-containing protein [Terriglobales bacterium]
MEQLERGSSLTLQDWWLRICHRRMLILAVVFAGWAAVTAVAWFLPAKYRSETVILIEQQRVPEKLVEPNIATDLQQRLQSMSEQILSRTRLMSIVDKFHLYSKKRQLDPDRLVELMRNDIAVELIKGSRPDQISAFKVSYSANSAVVAQQVTGELTSLFIEENLRNRAQLSQDTTDFLQNQLEDARKDLDQQEQRLREFKNRYMGQLPDQTTSNLQILSGLQGRLQAATDALNQAEQQRLYLQSMLSQYRALREQMPVVRGSSAPLPPAYELDNKLEQMKSQLADLSAKYTSKHPDIIRLQEEIASTEKLKEQIAQRAKTPQSNEGSEKISAVVGDTQSATAIVQVESQLKANELDITNRKIEIKKLEGDIEEYQQRLNLAPAREQELAVLTRDHEQSRLDYESLLAKRNQSEMATDLEKRQQGEQFRMIDPPNLPQKPYFPNRLNFSLGGLGFGLALALGIVLLIEFSMPRVYREEELQAIVASPLVLTIPPLHTAQERRRKTRRFLMELAAATAVLVTIPSITLLIYLKG